MPDGQPEQNPYDVLPYVDYPYSATHPRHLEALAALFGMDPSPIPACRVLELGCAAGGNLIPQAEDLPGSTFVGIDSSRRQINNGNQLVQTLGLKNIELRPADIMDMDRDWGQFDYIICHGVLSWVPPEVQNKIIEVCAENLAPNGVAVISYNTYPGWHLTNIVRDMMLYHTSQITDSNEQAREAKELLQFMAEAGTGDRAVEKVFREELELLGGNTEANMFHDLLEPDNRPFYFSQLMAWAADKGLQYLAEAEINTMRLNDFPERIRRALEGLPLIEQEQYLDFLQCRRFRSSLLCRREIALQRDVPLERISQFHFALPEHLQPIDVDPFGREPTEFKLSNCTMTVCNPIIKAALMYLDEVYPRHAHFDELHAMALSRIELFSPREHSDARESAEALASGLKAGHGVGMFDICLHPPRCVSRPGQRPVASPLARLQAANGSRVTNQLHKSVDLGDMHRHLVRCLDGCHDRPAMLLSLQEAIAAGDIGGTSDGRVPKNVDPTILAFEVERMLSRISESALMVA